MSCNSPDSYKKKEGDYLYGLERRNLYVDTLRYEPVTLEEKIKRYKTAARIFKSVKNSPFSTPEERTQATESILRIGGKVLRAELEMEE